MRGLAVRARGGVRRLSAGGVFAFSRETGLLLFALGLLNASNYLFHVVVSRQLGPSDYGALAALLAVLLVVSVPLGVLQTVVAQRTATLRAQGRSSEITALAGATTAGVVPIVVAAGIGSFLIATPLLAVFLDVTLASASLLAPYVVLGTLGAIPLGVLQGAMRFGGFAIVVVSGVVVRLGAGIGLVHLGLGLPGALLASSLAAGTSLVLGLWLIGLRRNALVRVRRSLDWIRGDFRIALYGLISFWVLAQADIALARHFLDPEEAGHYSSAGLLARALLFATAAVAFVAFPRYVSARERGDDTAHWLRTSLLAGGVLTLTGLAVLVLLRESIVDVTFDDRYAPAAALLPLLGGAMAAFALVGLLTYFHIAMGSRAYVISLAGLAVEIGLVALYHESAEQIAAVVAAVALGVALAQYAAARSLARWQPPHARLASSGVASAQLESRPQLELSVVLPCHNAAAGLRRTLEDLTNELQPVDSYEIIVVSDGSTDETVQIAEQFPRDEVRLLHYPDRSGKGHALQVGLTEARGRYVAFIDADGDIGPEAIGPFLTIMRLYEPDVVLGSKRHPLSEVHYPASRRLMSWGYHKLTRLLFRVNVRDTQTGMKLVRRDVLAAVLPRLYEKRYAFDLELLVVARGLGYSRVFEAPVRVDYKFSSQVRLGSVVRVALDTAAIFYRNYILGSYAGAGEPPDHQDDDRGTASGHAASDARRNGRTRILFLNWRDIANPTAGGAEVFTHEVARRWVAEGHDVSLLTSGFDGAANAETVDGVHVRRVGRLRTGSFHLALQRELARLHGFDAVIDGVNTVPSLAAAVWRHRLPFTVVLVHQLARDVWDCELPRPLAAIGRWAEPRLLRPYRDFPTVAVSRSTSNDLRELGFRDIVVVPPGRDEPSTRPSIEREATPTFLFAGRLAANKRPDHAVEAFRHIRALLPDARLWIAGRGPLEETLAASAPTGAELLGYVSREELYERMARAHCVLVPSVREGWGIVVIEANSVGTPAVAYDVPGLRDSVRDGETGRLATAGEPEALAYEAVALLDDPGSYRAMSRHATAWAESFSWDETARRLFELIQDGTEQKAMPTRDRHGVLR